MSQAINPHSMDAVPAVPAVPERAPARRARFTVLDETGHSPYETESSWPKIALAAVGVGVLALGGFFLRGSGGPELKETAAAPVAPAAAAAPANDPSRSQAAWAKEQANLKPAATVETAAQAAPPPAAKPAGAKQAAASVVPAAPQAAAPVAAKAPAATRDNSYAAAPIRRARKASDNPYADPPVQRAAPSDNPY